MGYLPQRFHVFQRLTVSEALEYVAVLKRCDRKEAQAAMEALHLKEERNTRVGALSGGMQRRLGVAQALLGDADVLILDEPTVGLDPMHRAHLRDRIAAIAQNRTVLLSTHIVEDVESIAQSVAILSRGHVLVHEDTRALLEALAGKVGIVKADAASFAEGRANVKILQSKPEADGTTLRILADPLPADAVPVAPTLEDVYFSCAGNPYAS